MKNFIMNWYSTTLITILIFLFSLPVRGQHAGNAAISDVSRKQWVKETSRELRKFNPENCVNYMEPETMEIDGYFRISYRMTEPGCIRFENGDWIYLVSNSSHFNEKVGDITLAIDNQNRRFINEGHVCAGIIHFIIEEKVEVKSADQFFELFVSDTDSIHWRKMD